MGITNRDYYREPTSGSGMFGIELGSMTRRIVVVTVVAFLLQFLITVPVPIERPGLSGFPAAQDLGDPGFNGRQMVVYVPVLEEWGSVTPLGVQRGEVWRLLTYAFLHSRYSVMHILFNMMALWSFGPLMEALWGRREFLAYYCTAAIFAGICHVILGLSVREYAGAVGASGAIMALLMAFAVYYPRQLVTVFFFTLEARFLVAIYVLWDGFPVLQMLAGRAGGLGTGVAHAAHLGGLAFGFLYCVLGWRLTGWLDRFSPARSRQATRTTIPATRSTGWATWWKRMFQSRPNLKLHTEPPPEPSPPPYQGTRDPGVHSHGSRDLESRVDAVLKKIKEVGEANITEEDRNVLREAAQAYRKRNG